MNPALIERLLQIVAAANAAGHGGKLAVYQHAADEMGISVKTLQRQLKEVQMQKTRKQRADAGDTALTIDEARHISAYLIETQRNNGKRLSSIEDAVEVLRSNGTIQAGRVDESSGEFKPLSVSAISRALRAYAVHPEQLARPAPKQQLASLHPNHVWQIDPSLCVLYYLPAVQGLQVMDEKAFYKNKPANIRKIENERVWRYVITDHASGVIYVHYVLGAESGKNLVEAFISATQQRHESDPFSGVPLMVMVDPGSANTGAVFQNLCKALGVHVQVNLPGQPWAKGQVEKANDIVERNFEHRLKFLANPPQCLEDINVQAWAWMRWFNATKIHSRTKQTRYAVWQTITQAQKRIAPEPTVMRELAVSAPQTRKVTPQLTISWAGKQFSVADVPNVMVGEKLMITRNPWRASDSAQVIYTDEDGHEVIQVLDAIGEGAYGFAETAVVIGEEYRSHADTRLDTERKIQERLLMGTDTDEAAAKARKNKQVAFNGEINPMKPITDTLLPAQLQKRGTSMDISSPLLELKPLSHVEAAKRLSASMGSAWVGSEHFAWLKQQYPAGVAEDELEGISERLSKGASPLRLIK